MNIALAELVERLFIIDHRIWELEADIREGKENSLGLEEVGRRALKIRDLNKQRIGVKNEINKRFDPENFYEEYKVKHSSEEKEDARSPGK